MLVLLFEWQLRCLWVDLTYIAEQIFVIPLQTTLRMSDELQDRNEFYINKYKSQRKAVLIVI